MIHAYYWFCSFAAINALLVLLLALNVSRLRISKKIPYGDGGDKDMNQAIRAHANAVEQVCIFGFLVLALNLMFVSDIVLGGLVVLFSLSRLFHAYGMLCRSFSARRLGAMFSYLSQALAIYFILTGL